MRWASNSVCVLTGALTALGAAAFEGEARAGSPLTFTWSAPAACPSEKAVLAEITRLLGGSLARAQTAVTARGEITRQAPGEYRLSLSLTSAGVERTRELRSGSCAELGDAAALIVALAIDPSALSSAPEVTPQPADPAAKGGNATEQAQSAQPVIDDAAPPPPPLPVPIELSPMVPAITSFPVVAPVAPVPVFRYPVLRAPRKMPVARWDGRLTAVAGGEAGLFRGPSPHFRLGVVRSTPGFRVGAEGQFVWGDHIALPGEDAKGGQFWMAGLHLHGCLERALDRRAPGPSRLWGALCVGFEGGVVHAVSEGIASPGQATGPWLAPALQAIFGWVLTPFMRARLDVGLSVPVVRPEFRIVGLGPVHQIGPVSGRLGLGVEVELPRGAP